MTGSRWVGVVAGAVRSLTCSGRRRVPSSPATNRASARPPGTQHPAYRGDFAGVATVAYEPAADGDADPGEVVWAWVPYEEDHERGKDRPVLVVGRDGDALLGLMLTSKDHDRDATAEAASGRRWLDLGTGGWDRQGRPSEVRLDRVIRLEPAAVRREGDTLDRARYDRVAAELRRLHGWR